MYLLYNNINSKVIHSVIPLVDQMILNFQKKKSSIMANI